MQDPRIQLDLPTASLLGLVGIWAVVHASVGTIIAWRRPGNRIGRLMQLAAPLLILGFFGYLIGAVRYALAGSSDLLGGVAAWWGSTSLVPVLVLAFPLLGIVFPDGRLPTPAFRRPLRFDPRRSVGRRPSIAVTAGPVDKGSRTIRSASWSCPRRPTAVLGFLTSLVWWAPSSWRSPPPSSAGDAARPWRRAQLKWLLAALVGRAAPVRDLVGHGVGPAAVVFDLLSIGSALAVSLAVGVAVLRYRLYEIDRIISRTLT